MWRVPFTSVCAGKLCLLYVYLYTCVCVCYIYYSQYVHKFYNNSLYNIRIKGRRQRTNDILFDSYMTLNLNIFIECITLHMPLICATMIFYMSFYSFGKEPKKYKGTSDDFYLTILHRIH